MNQRLFGILLLLFTDLIWGSSFVAQSVGMDYVGPFTFQFARCGMAVLVLLMVVFLRDRRKGTSFAAGWQSRVLWRGGLLCGTALFAASNLQQIGLIYTTAGKAGFITAMYIILVPVLSLFLGRRSGWRIWVSVSLGVGGLALLSLHSGQTVNTGDLYMLGSALCFSVQILLVEHFSPKADGVRLSCLQILVCGVLSGLVSLFRETVTWQALSACWLPLIYAGVLSLAGGYTMQIVAQRWLPAPVASLAMSMESVFAALSGWVVLHQAMSPRELAGCALMLAAIVLAQLPQRRGAESNAV